MIFVPHQKYHWITSCRFSDSMVGGISASWLHQEVQAGRKTGEILHLEPSTHRGLSYISLAERIMGLPDLKVLYPNKPKNQVFSKYVQVRARFCAVGNF